MTLAAGTRLDAYEILGLLGAGGMGEVYRARDHRLERDVAVKVLPEAMARDAHALNRFQREVRVVASPRVRSAIRTPLATSLCGIGM